MTWDSLWSRAGVPRVSWVWGGNLRTGGSVFSAGTWASGLLPMVWAVSTPFGRDHSQPEDGGNRGLGLPWSSQQERKAAAIDTSGHQEQPLIFLFPSQPIGGGGLRGGAGRQVEGHLRLLFNEAIRVPDRVTCIKCTRLLIHLVIKQGIAPGLPEPEMMANFHLLHRWGN